MQANCPMFTIGYSPHTLAGFLELLKQYQITALADVRSRPYSAHRPEFNHKNLKKNLPEQGIKHLFLGRELGARYEDESVYVEGRADYEKIARHPLFRAGLQRLRQELEKHAVAIMCAEKEPLHCHRTILIAGQLRQEVQIRHILGQGSSEKHQDTEQRLLQLYGLHRAQLPGLEESKASRLHRAYREHGQNIAWHSKKT